MMDKAEFMNRVRQARAGWEAILAEVGEDRMEEPGLPGGWTVKDAVAHVVWSEREMVGLLKMRELAGSELWNLPTDERNQVVYEENRGRDLADVLAEAGQVYADLAAEIEKLDQAALNDPGAFKNMPADWLPWQILAGSTYKHYAEHAADIRAWLGE